MSQLTGPFYCSLYGKYYYGPFRQLPFTHPGEERNRIYTENEAIMAGLITPDPSKDRDTKPLKEDYFGDLYPSYFDW